MVMMVKERGNIMKTCRAIQKVISQLDVYNPTAPQAKRKEYAVR